MDNNADSRRATQFKPADPDLAEALEKTMNGTARHLDSHEHIQKLLDIDARRDRRAQQLIMCLQHADRISRERRKLETRLRELTDEQVMVNSYMRRFLEQRQAEDPEHDSHLAQIELNEAAALPEHQQTSTILQRRGKVSVRVARDRDVDVTAD